VSIVKIRVQIMFETGNIYAADHVTGGNEVEKPISSGKLVFYLCC